MEEKVQELTKLLNEAEHAHGKAYVETKGFDPDWAMWYADYLLPKLLPLLEASMSKSELVHLLVRLDRLQRADAPGAKWARYYARYLVARYL